MKKITFYLSLMAIVFMSIAVSAQELPNDWTGDTGIDTYQESNNVHSGSYSCRVDVNTGSQSSCDMRSLEIPVTEGDTYTFSFFVVSSEHQRARVVLQWVGASTTYGSYSTPGTSTFEEIIQTGTVPTGATGVLVGCRFYDVSGFVAGETQYIDDFTFQSPDGTFLTVVNGDMESWNIGGDPTEIVKAYAISNTEIDVFYDQDLTSVDYNDYSLSGSQSITFNVATIDPGDAKLVHLTTTTSMTGDATLDNLHDDGWGFDFPFYAGITSIAYFNTTNPGGTLSDGYIATVQGIISANDAYNNAWISDDIGAYNGVMIYSNAFAAEVTVGDELLMIGERAIYNGLTELVEPVIIETISTGNIPYGPDVISGSDIDETIIVDTDPAESWEGQLVTIENFTVESYVDYDYTCSWSDAKTTYYFHVGDNVDYHLANINMNVGETYVSIIGVIDWNDFSGYYRINPRLQDDIVSNAPPQIINAYALSTTEIDVLYDQNLITVDYTDYSLSGSQSLIFTSAVIDPENAKLVHLTTNSSMASDATLDNIHDDGWGLDFQFYAGITPIAFTNTNNPGGTLLNGYMATFNGKISANDGYNNLWFSDAEGAYNGVLIYDYDLVSTLEIGDFILLAGVRDVYQNLTQITNTVFISKAGIGSDPYGPDLIPGSDIDVSLGADTNPGEQWEGQFVTIENFTVDSYTDFDYLCSWSDSKTTYYFNISDDVDYQLNNISLTVGQTYESVTGVVSWDYGDGFYRINPRFQDDIVANSNPADNLAIISVNGGVDPQENVAFDVVIQSHDEFGNPATVTSDINITLTTNGGNSGNVIFTGTTTGILATGLSQVTISGVMMSPADTDVNITASDDALFLSPGTSSLFNITSYIAPDIIITEIMQNPDSVGDGAGEWFEVFNTTQSPIDMIGWILTDNGTNRDTIDANLIVPPQGFAVLGINSDNMVNGDYTCDYQYENFFLANGDDEIILSLNDGTEVSRVEYDGGPDWPDPHGASMVFIGTSEMFNNNGSLWMEATLREPTYVGTEGDFGSPGTNGQDQNLIIGDDTFVDLKVFLEGPYMNNNMDASLNGLGLIPLDQPFNTSPWDYMGSESVGVIPGSVVDWVLLDIRDATDANNALINTSVQKIACFVLQDGSVVDLNGITAPKITATITEELFVVVYHRNHLPVMNGQAMDFSGNTYTFDFTVDPLTVYGTDAVKNLGNAIYGMYGGDAMPDGIINSVINSSDLSNAWNSAAGINAYDGADLNMDGQVDNVDKNDVFIPNEGEESQLPQL